MRILLVLWLTLASGAALGGEPAAKAGRKPFSIKLWPPLFEVTRRRDGSHMVHILGPLLTHGREGGRFVFSLSPLLCIDRDEQEQRDMLWLAPFYWRSERGPKEHWVFAVPLLVGWGSEPGRADFTFRSLPLSYTTCARDGVQELRVLLLFAGRDRKAGKWAVMLPPGIGTCQSPQNRVWSLRPLCTWAVQGTRHRLFVLGPLFLPSSAPESEKAEATGAGRLDALEGILIDEPSLVGGTVATKPQPTSFLNTPLLFYEWDTQSRDGAAALWTLASMRREGDCLRTRWLSLGAARKPKDKGILRRHVVWSDWLFTYERGRNGARDLTFLSIRELLGRKPYPYPHQWRAMGTWPLIGWHKEPHGGHLHVFPFLWHHRERDGDNRRVSFLGPLLRYERDAAGRRLRLLHFIRIPLGRS